MRVRRPGRLLWRGLALLLLLVAAAALWLVVAGWSAFGEAPSGARLATLERSPQWQDDAFANRRGSWLDRAAAYGNLLTGSAVTEPEPDAPVPAVRPAAAAFAEPPASGLRITWFGHSSALVEIDGARVLTDPMWV